MDTILWVVTSQIEGDKRQLDSSNSFCEIFGESFCHLSIIKKPFLKGVYVEDLIFKMLFTVHITLLI